MRTRRSARIGLPAVAAGAAAAALCLSGAAAASTANPGGGPGSQLWLSSYSGPDHSFDSANAAVASPDGSMVYVTGNSKGSNNVNDDYATVAYNSATGEQLWASRYDGPGGGVDIPFAIGISPDGGTVYVTGESVGADGGFDYATIAHNAKTGVQKWLQRYSGPHDSWDVARSLVVSPGGRSVYVTGYGGAPAATTT